MLSQCFLPSFKTISLLFQEKKRNRFSRWQPRRPSWITDRNNFSYFFYLQIIPMPPTKFQVNWQSCIFDWNNFSYCFYRQVTLMLPTMFLVNCPFGLGKKKRKMDFQDGSHGCHLGYPIGMILAILDLQVALMLPTKIKVNWQKIDVQDLATSIGMILAIFFICKSPRCFLPSFKSVGLSVQEKKQKINLKMAAIFNFRSVQFYLFLIYKSPQ